MIGFKLLRRRKDGSLGPLFIGRTQRLEVGVTYAAKALRTPGYAFRPGWHILSKPQAPHLSKTGRVWARVWFTDAESHIRPRAQGGRWFTAQRMRILEVR